MSNGTGLGVTSPAQEHKSIFGDISVCWEGSCVICMIFVVVVFTGLMFKS